MFSIIAMIMPAVDHLDPKFLPDATQQYEGIALYLMKLAHEILQVFHLDSHSGLFIYVYTLLVFVISFGIGLILQWILVKIGNKLSKHLTNDIYVNLVGDKFFLRVCRIIPAVIFLIFIRFTLFANHTLANWLTRFALIYIIILIAMALCSLVNVLWNHVNNRENKRKLPLNGLVSLLKGIIWIIALIVIVAILLDKSPGSLLAGMGAFAAVLMLVFKDSILGVVAGVQLSDNDSLHVGDWIKTGDANGIVREVSLTQVKVQNWDKTVTTMPPYSLVSNGFTNYRAMQESETRQVSRSYLIDADSVVAATDEMLNDLATIPLLKDWIDKKRAQQAAGKIEDVSNSEGLVDGSIETNLGIFRAYMTLYLQNNPNVLQVQDDITALFVTTLPQTPSGIPLQLYFFTSTSHWVPYESIMAAIFEHMALMLGRFKLVGFSDVSGRDAIVNGYLSAGKDPAGLPSL